MSQHETNNDDRQHVTVDKVVGAVPTVWLLAALWAVTMSLSGWWASTMQANVAALAESHARAERLAAGYEVRLTAVERNEAQFARAPELTDIKQRLDRMERKLDVALDRDDSGRTRH